MEKEFLDPITEDLDFVKYFHNEHTCWRCILLLFKSHEISLYRAHEHSVYYNLIGDGLLKRDEAKMSCKICYGVLQHAETFVEKIADEVKSSGYEFSDFKMSFSISLRASL